MLTTVTNVLVRLLGFAFIGFATFFWVTFDPSWPLIPGLSLFIGFCLITYPLHSNQGENTPE